MTTLSRRKDETTARRHSYDIHSTPPPHDRQHEQIRSTTHDATRHRPHSTPRTSNDDDQHDRRQPSHQHTEYDTIHHNTAQQTQTNQDDHTTTPRPQRRLFDEQTTTTADDSTTRTPNNTTPCTHFDTNDELILRPIYTRNTTPTPHSTTQKQDHNQPTIQPQQHTEYDTHDPRLQGSKQMENDT